MAVFILEDALCVWTNLGKLSLSVWLFVSSVKTGTRRIIRLDELSFVVRLERRTTEDSLTRRIMSLVPVFTLEMNDQTNNEYTVFTNSGHPGTSDRSNVALEDKTYRSQKLGQVKKKRCFSSVISIKKIGGWAVFFVIYYLTISSCRASACVCRDIEHAGSLGSTKEA